MHVIMLYVYVWVQWVLDSVVVYVVILVGHVHHTATHQRVVQGCRMDTRLVISIHCADSRVAELRYYDDTARLIYIIIYDMCKHCYHGCCIQVIYHHSKIWCKALTLTPTMAICS